MWINPLNMLLEADHLNELASPGARSWMRTPG
jgi:hypothetical protein